MNELIKVNEEVLSELTEILQEMTNYYKNLYSSKLQEEWTDFAPEFTQHDTKISETAKHSCDAKLSLDELSEALKSMKNGKSPGSDGFTADDYKFFCLKSNILYTDLCAEVWKEENYQSFKLKV